MHGARVVTKRRREAGSECMADGGGTWAERGTTQGNENRGGRREEAQKDSRKHTVKSGRGCTPTRHHQAGNAQSHGYARFKGR